MKQLLFLFSFVLLASFSVNAQCSSSAAAGKSCCMSKKTSSADANAKANDMASLTSMEAEAEAAMAASNGNIIKKTCEMSGTTKYYGKVKNTGTGEDSWNEVKYDSSKKAFTEVASAYMEKDDAGNKVETKSCAGEKSGEMKSCSGSKAATKSCCSSKK